MKLLPFGVFFFLEARGCGGFRKAYRFTTAIAVSSCSAFFGVFCFVSNRREDAEVFLKVRRFTAAIDVSNCCILVHGGDAEVFLQLNRFTPAAAASCLLFFSRRGEAEVFLKLHRGGQRNASLSMQSPRLELLAQAESHRPEELMRGLEGLVKVRDDVVAGNAPIVMNNVGVSIFSC